MFHRIIPMLAFALAVVAWSGPVMADDQRALVEAALHRASGLMLAEIVEVTESDERPGDGNLTQWCRVKPLRSSGATMDRIGIVRKFGGFRPPDSPEPRDGPIRLDTLVPGRRYWFALSSMHEYHEHPQGVIAFWPDDPGDVVQSLEQAIDVDRFRWCPQYDPNTQLTYGRLVEPELNRWRIRVRDDNGVLWERLIEGVPSTRSSAFILYPNPPQGQPIDMQSPENGWQLYAETAKNLPDDNQFGLAAGRYYIRTTFDARTGNVQHIMVSLLQDGMVEKVSQVFDAKSGALHIERRWDWRDTGGLEAGAPAAQWLRQVEREYDIASGRLLRHDTMRQDEGGKWVNVNDQSHH